MAIKPLLVCLGQSNGEPVSDEIAWIILHPGLFLAITSNNAVGSYNDLFTMPGGFPGFTSLNLKGLASKEGRYLTFYNPWATSYRNYPGTGRVATAGGTTTITTEQRWVNIGQTCTITRALTGTTHTATFNTTTTVDVSPAFSPAAVLDEQFTYTFVATATGATTTVVPLNLRWDSGGATGKLTGVRINGITGANAGLTRTISSVNAATGAVTVSSAWSASANGDVYTLSPPDNIPFHEWGYFLPWCPFEGAVTTDKTNPYPPGFNYPNDAATMRTYNPSTGGPVSGHGASYHTGLTLSVAQLEATDSRIVTLAIGGTSLHHSESFLTDASVTGWLDVAQQTHWAPSSENGLFARLMDVLDTAKAQAIAEGHTLECYAVVNLQGEGDTGPEGWPEAYEENLREFVVAVRQAIKDRGLYSGEAKNIVWVQPQVTNEPWGDGAVTVRQAIENLAIEDPYFRTFETNDIAKIDSAHYSGVGQTTVEQRVLAEILDVRRIAEATDKLELCNLALSYIGNKARVTSVDPPDGSPEADLCASFFPIALKAVLRMHAWSFALERRALTVINTDETDSDNPSYIFRYEIPANCVKALKVVPEDAPSDDLVGGVRVPVDFKILRSSVDRKKRIYTNQPNAHLRYVMHQIDLSQWDELALLVLGWQTASMLAGAIIKLQEGAAERDRCLRMMAFYLAQAQAEDSNERQVTLDRPAAQIQARR